MNRVYSCDCCDLALAPCESVWTCARDRARLSCQLRQHNESDFEIEVVRNGRLYGSYRFGERAAAVIFAARLRETFHGTGWVAA